jgi:hypothetical protein
MKRILFIRAQVILLLIVAVFGTDMNRMDQRLPSAHAQSVSFLDQPLDLIPVWAYLDGMEIYVNQYPRQVRVFAWGEWGNECWQYLYATSTQSREGFTLDVELTTWWEVPPGPIGCGSSTVYWEAWIDLDVAGLEAATYTVQVNGSTGNFELPEEGTPTPTVTGTPPTATPTSTSTITSTRTDTPTWTATATPIFTPTPVPDFTLSVSPTSQSVGRGGTTTYTVNLIANSSYSGNVTLSVSGLPDRINYSFSPNPLILTPGGTRSSVLTITTNRGAPTGTYTLTITGTDRVRTRSQTVTLIVNR